MKVLIIGMGIGLATTLSVSSCLSNAKLDRICAERFPAHDSIVVKTTVETKYDTTWLESPMPEILTVQTDCPPSDTASVVVKKIPCPPCAEQKVIREIRYVNRDSIRFVMRKINVPSDKPPSQSYLWYLIGSLALNALFIYLLMKFR
jgi:hypothetical protein